MRASGAGGGGEGREGEERDSSGEFGGVGWGRAPAAPGAAGCRGRGGSRSLRPGRRQSPRSESRFGGEGGSRSLRRPHGEDAGGHGGRRVGPGARGAAAATRPGGGSCGRDLGASRARSSPESRSAGPAGSVRGLPGLPAGQRGAAGPATRGCVWGDAGAAARWRLGAVTGRLGRPEGSRPGPARPCDPLYSCHHSGTFGAAPNGAMGRPAPPPSPRPRGGRRAPRSALRGPSGRRCRPGLVPLVVVVPGLGRRAARGTGRPTRRSPLAELTIPAVVLARILRSATKFIFPWVFSAAVQVPGS